MNTLFGHVFMLYIYMNNDLAYLLPTVNNDSHLTTCTRAHSTHIHTEREEVWPVILYMVPPLSGPPGLLVAATDGPPDRQCLQ